MLTMLQHASLFALLTLLLATVPLAMAVTYVLRPTERHLALMRPFSLVGLFASIAGTLTGFINALMPVWRREPELATYRIMAIGAAEALVPMVVGFACLAAAWLLVAVGMSREGARM